VEWQVSRKLARLGFLFFVLQVSAGVAFASDNLIATQVLGASAAAHFSVAQRIFMIPPLLMALIIGPLWPAYGEALARGDRGWVRRTFYGSLALTISCCAVLAAGLVLLSEPIFSHWVGPALVPSAALAVGLAIWSIMYTWGTTVAMLLNAASIIGFQVVTALALAFSSIALKVALISHVGIAGLAWALVVSYTVVVFVPTSLYLARWFRQAW
jgi:O-antigen/teichoic acid export membrane protein